MNLKERVLLKLDEMTKYLSELEQLIPSSPREYSANITIKRACEKTIELAIGCVINVISMIISAKRLGSPLVRMT